MIQHAHDAVLQPLKRCAWMFISDFSFRCFFALLLVKEIPGPGTDYPSQATQVPACELPARQSHDELWSTSLGSPVVGSICKGLESGCLRDWFTTWKNKAFCILKLKPLIYQLFFFQIETRKTRNHIMIYINHRRDIDDPHFLQETNIVFFSNFM